MTEPQAPPPHIGILMILNGLHVAGAVAALAELRIPDLIDDAPQSADELAAKANANPAALYRLMRATACVGVLNEGADGKFSHTPLSRVLRTDSKPSLGAFARMYGREWHLRGWSHLDYSVRTGQPTMQKMYGVQTFEYFRQNPEEGRCFNDGMTDVSTMDAPAVADAYDFSGIQSIVDVGGGHGLLLSTILSRNPHLKGTLYEMQYVIDGATSGPLKPVMDRCTLTAGDMFADVPSGADAYMMKHIIHDWPDDKCMQILKACRKGVNAGGKLLVVDCVIQPGNDFSPAKFLDLQMLLFPSGLERTERQFRDLFAASGWKLTRVIPTRVLDSIVEAVPA